MIEWVLVVCINASGAECQTRSYYPYATEAECHVARMETGLPQPDKNYAPAYRGQNTAYCIAVKDLEE